jgi:hypothetical protein
LFYFAGVLFKLLISVSVVLTTVMWIRKGGYRIQDLWKVNGADYLLNYTRLLSGSSSTAIYMVTRTGNIGMNTKRKIPRIIHQTWISEDIPEPVVPFVKSWQKHMPDWEYWFWSDQDADDFISTIFPSFYKMYRDYPENIQRADAIRYFILYEFGGVYADFDVKALRSLDSLTNNHYCILPLEPMIHAVKMWSVDHLVSNAFMASRPRHPAMKLIIQNLPLNMPSFFKRGPMDTTGPIFLTRQISAYERLYLHSEKLLPENRIFIAPVGLFIPRKETSRNIEDFCKVRQRLDKAICESAQSLNYTDIASSDKPYTSHEYVHTYFGTLDKKKTENIRTLVPRVKDVRTIFAHSSDLQF